MMPADALRWAAADAEATSRTTCAAMIGGGPHRHFPTLFRSNG